MTGVFSGIWRRVCPRCREGAIYRASLWRGYLAMHQKCPVCGLTFDREPGYFMGAMYISYLFSIPPAFGIMLLLWHWTNWSFNTVIIGGFVCYLPLVPIVTRYARVIWIYLDQHFDPEKIT